MPEYYAHTREDKYGNQLSEQNWHLLKDHLRSVAEKSRHFAEPMKMGEEAYVAGLLHDFGKYGDNFQKRLRHQISHVNHWAHGAKFAFDRGAFLAAFSIAGHHVGIPKRSDMGELIQDVQNGESRMQKLRLNEDLSELLRRAVEDGLDVNPTGFSGDTDGLRRLMKENPIAFGLRLRMLFSALVDADFLDTENFCNPTQSQERREIQRSFEPEKILKILEDHLHQLRKPGWLGNLRHDFLSECLEAADKPTGLYTLTGPTGIGKTLASLAFALRHAVEHQKRRAIVVIPYTTIIEQTANTYRNIFEKEFGAHFVLEHHSNFIPPTKEEDAEDSVNPADRRHRLLSENWASPVVVTTTVQFFDSLFANRPRDCRKLHNVTESVIFFDEVQTLPVGLLKPTLSALKSLVADFGCTVVLGTATQPAFRHISGHVEGGWNPVEIIKNPNRYASSLKNRVRYEFEPEMMAGVSHDYLAAKILETGSALCVVNTKLDAEEIWRAVNRRKGSSYPVTEENPDFAHLEVLHLSTTLCADHRRQILEAARQRLNKGVPVILISTQLIEAGVDIDFPVVFRALGPLDSIIQSAGRCNREGGLSGLGETRIFKLEKHKYPKGVYKTAAEITASLYTECLEENRPFDVENPDLLETYFTRLYGNHEIDTKNILELASAERLDFPEIAKRYHVIDDSTRAVLVPWSEGVDIIDQLKKIGHWTRPLLQKAKAYSVNFYQNKFNDWIAAGVIKVVGEGGEIAYWNLKYHPYLGAVEPQMEEMIV